MISLNFSKAFDVLNPSILLTKLLMLGIGDKAFLDSWTYEFLYGQCLLWLQVK